MATKFTNLLENLDMKAELKMKDANQLTNTEYNLKFRQLVQKMLFELEEYDIINLFELINNVYHKLFPNKSSLDVILCNDVRVPTIKRFGRYSHMHNLSKELVRISYEEKGKLIQESKDKITNKNSDRIPFSDNQILEIIEKFKISQDPYERSISLLMASGSRPIELFSKSSYSEYRKGWIIQEKIAKKRDDNHTNVIKPLIHLSTEEFLESLSFIRENIVDPLKDDKLKPQITIKCNKIMKTFFEDPRITLYSCRAFYCNLSYLKYSKNSIHGHDPSANLWINKVLGHLNNDLNTCNSYLNYYVIENNKKIDTHEPVANSFSS